MIDLEKAIFAQRTAKESLASVLTHFEREAQQILEVVPRPNKFISIGCGVGGVEKFLLKEWKCPALLLDKDGWEPTYGFSEEKRFYNSFEVTRQMLGPQMETVTFCTPDSYDLAGVDLTLSFLSAGFHYPMSQYREAFSLPWVADIRHGQLPDWGPQSRKSLFKNDKYSRIYAT